MRGRRGLEGLGRAAPNSARVAAELDKGLETSRRGCTQTYRTVRLGDCFMPLNTGRSLPRKRAAAEKGCSVACVWTAARWRGLDSAVSCVVQPRRGLRAAAYGGPHCEGHAAR
jgi:hypothetical protein